MGGVEDAAAIGEATVSGSQTDKVEGLKIEYMNPKNAGRDLLSIGSNILNGSTPNETWDACKTLNTRDVSLGDF